MTKKQELLALERIAKAVREYAKQQGMTFDALGEKLDISRATVYNLAGSTTRRRAPRAVALPSGDVLSKVSALTGISVDWLLGFEVPQQRDARLVIGDFAEHLRSSLEQAFDGPVSSAPDQRDGAPDDDGGNEWVRVYAQERGIIRFPESAGELIEKVQGAYWQAQIYEVAQDKAPGFQTLGLMLREKMRELQHRKSEKRVFLMLGDMLNAARAAHAFAAVLNSFDVGWGDIADLDAFPAGVAQYNQPDDAPPLYTPFGVSGGIRGAAYAFQEEDSDRFSMFWVDRRTGEARFDAGLAGPVTDEPPEYPYDETPSAGFWATHSYDEYPMPPARS
ncbi:MAG TPA: helix-turn-helix transcriptional regulator [Burkholderiales bacterium]|nr:helix-turn-helix transcriptional regulator [Burkholderiales bacterium]